MRSERGGKVRFRKLRLVLQAGACVAAGALLVVLLLTNLRRTTVPPRRSAPHGVIALRVSDHLGQLHIQWDLHSPAVLQCLAAYLAITDGPAPVLIDLDQTTLRTGSVYYLPHSERGAVRMALITPAGKSEEESVQFVVSTVPARSVLPLTTGEPSASAELQTPGSEPPPVAGIEAADRIFVEVPPGIEPAPPRRFRPPVPAHVPRLAARAQLEPPQLLVPPRADVRAVPAPVAPRPSSVPAPIPAPAPAPAKAPPVAEAGQIIWTGKLERRGVLEIDGRQASIGYLSGTLPGAPAAVQVFPGELLPGGLRLYTANAALANRSEAAGPHNGWNDTNYVWDPTRAMDITVLESPGSHNGWQRLALRAENRSYAVIVVRWSALRPGRP